MKAFENFKGIIAPMNRVNVDTDQIIPKQFLKKIERTGFGRHLFHDWRFLDDAGEKENPEFELNREPYRHAPILLAGDNFGCGSSREHAPWALADYGIRVIISSSFADIFYNNCFKNGMLPVAVSDADLARLFQATATRPGLEGEVDLENQTLRAGDIDLRIEVDPGRKRDLLLGLDDIGKTLENAGKIDQFEKEYDQKFPFLNRQLV